jgi:ketosteroid isomerase-like protein
MPTLTPGDGQDLVARFKRAREHRDVDLAVSLFRDDAELRPDPFEPPLTGANAIRAFWNDIAASQLHVEFDAERVWVAGTTVLASWHEAFTRSASAERVRRRGFMTLELDQGGFIGRLKEWSVTRVVGRDGTVELDAAGDRPGSTASGVAGGW